MAGFESTIERRDFIRVAALGQASGSRSVILGQSTAWRQVLKSATRVAPLETTICLQGESGTGKEVLARFIHRNSARRGGPFVAINCAALPEQLLESELFGFERGAFTNAFQAKPGQLELAAGGVLFLDEISEMAPAAQTKILRVLQEREFRRLGGTQLRKANVRVIVARIKTCKVRYCVAPFVKTCTIGSTCSKSGFRRCANAARTFCCSRAAFSRSSGISTVCQRST